MNNEKTSRTRKITSRVLNIILIIGMLAGGTSQVLGAEAQKEFFIRLGYPLFLMTIVGIGKILGAIVLMLPRLPLLKVSAYTGSFIVTTCAFISHLHYGEPLFAISPFIVACISVIACIINPNIVFVQAPSIKAETVNEPG
jgi:uncharacterized membrane protein YphA (DoxX/SURF4 family)